ncbi:MAG TPA: FtsX-like permease family protein [Edaphocola sp.]|nr:FtsX-like permease family protein [Edaphocola sp.]
MNLSLFIANKITNNKLSGFSKFILKLATIATTLSVAVMIVAVAVVQGFKIKIREKMFVFWGEVQVNSFQPNLSNIIGDIPFVQNEQLRKDIKSVKGVQNVYPYVVKPVILKADKALEGIQLKGIDAHYPQQSTDAITFQGNPIVFKDTLSNNDIILSQTTLNRLALKIGDFVLAVFFNSENESHSLRKLKIVGTYHTGMEEVDKGFAFCDIRLLQQINHWSPSEVSALQVEVKDYKEASNIANSIYQEYLQPPLAASSIEEVYPFIFSWLDFQNINAALVLIIMAIVAAINMATALLIYILERTSMIGVLKSLGMNNRNIRSIFMIHIFKVALKGVVLGTIVGLIICAIQYYFQPFRLNEEIYYVKAAPVAVRLIDVVLIDIFTLVFCMLIMLLPALIIRRINIVKALRFK